MASDVLSSRQMTFTETMEYIYPLKLCFEIPKASVLSHDNQYLYIANHIIHVIYLKNAKNLIKIYDSEVPITCIAISFDDSRLASGDESGKVLVFDTVSNDLLFTITNFKCFIQFISFLPNSNENMIIAYQKRILEYWYYTSNEFKKLEFREFLESLAPIQDGKSLYVVGEEEMKPCDWETETSLMEKMKIEYYGVYSRDRTHFIIANWSGSVTIINKVNNTSRSFNHNRNDGWLNYLVVSHDDQLVAASGASKNILVYCIKDPSLFHIFERNCSVEAKSLMFTKDSRHLISSFENVYICLWDLASKEKRIIGKHYANIFDAKMTDNALTFVTCAEDGIMVWDAVGFECIGKVDGHAGEVLGAVLNKKKTKLVTSGCDKFIKFWDLNTQKETGSLYVCKKFNCIKLTANNYVVGSNENIIYVFKSNL